MVQKKVCIYITVVDDLSSKHNEWIFAPKLWKAQSLPLHIGSKVQVEGHATIPFVSHAEKRIRLVTIPLYRATKPLSVFPSAAQLQPMIGQLTNNSVLTTLFSLLAQHHPQHHKLHTFPPPSVSFLQLSQALPSFSEHQVRLQLEKLLGNGDIGRRRECDDEYFPITAEHVFLPALKSCLSAFPNQSFSLEEWVTRTINLYLSRWEVKFEPVLLCAKKLLTDDPRFQRRIMLPPK